MKNVTKHVSFVLAVLLLAFSLIACGAEDKKNSDSNVHDSMLVGNWIIEKQVIVSGTTTSEPDVAGTGGWEIYANGMIRVMERSVDSESNLYYYDAEERYADYMIIAENQMALMKQSSNGEKYVDNIMEYSVKDNVLTLVAYGPDSSIAMTLKRMETPFYKYFPTAPENAESGFGDQSDDSVLEEE